MHFQEVADSDLGERLVALAGPASQPRKEPIEFFAILDEPQPTLVFVRNGERRWIVVLANPQCPLPSAVEHPVALWNDGIHVQHRSSTETGGCETK